jgi:hypothetical protein
MGRPILAAAALQAACPVRILEHPGLRPAIRPVGHKIGAFAPSRTADAEDQCARADRGQVTTRRRIPSCRDGPAAHEGHENGADSGEPLSGANFRSLAVAARQAAFFDRPPH